MTLLRSFIRGRPSFSQVISGGGIPAAVQVNNMASPTLELVFTGNRRMVTGPNRVKYHVTSYVK